MWALELDISKESPEHFENSLSFGAPCAFRTFKVIKVTDFCTNLNHIYDFLLIRHSNLGAILHCFRDIAGFCAHDSTLIPP